MPTRAKGRKVKLQKKSSMRIALSLSYNSSLPQLKWKIWETLIAQPRRLNDQPRFKIIVYPLKLSQMRISSSLLGIISQSSILTLQKLRPLNKDSGYNGLLHFVVQWLRELIKIVFPHLIFPTFTKNFSKLLRDVIDHLFTIDHTTNHYPMRTWSKEQSIRNHPNSNGNQNKNKEKPKI